MRLGTHAERQALRDHVALWPQSTLPEEVPLGYERTPGGNFLYAFAPSNPAGEFESTYVSIALSDDPIELPGAAMHSVHVLVLTHSGHWASVLPPCPDYLPRAAHSYATTWPDAFELARQTRAQTELEVAQAALYEAQEVARQAQLRVIAQAQPSWLRALAHGFVKSFAGTPTEFAGMLSALEQDSFTG